VVAIAASTGGPRALVAILGAFRAGLTIVNTNPMYTPRELQHQLHDSGARAILILENFAHNLDAVRDENGTRYVSLRSTEVFDPASGWQAPRTAPTEAGSGLSRESLDLLYQSEDWDTLTSMWWMTLKAAQDEAFKVHFYNPYRSTLERSMNHPIFGIYPLSWSLKVAREWIRFLFDNRIFGNGHLRLGMSPAAAIAEYKDMFNELSAREGVDMPALFSIEGGLGSSMMIASLLMPGDWSSLPFPFSRSIRDVVRGETNVGDLLYNNLGSGVVRDLRLTDEALNEIAAVVGRWGGEALLQEQRGQRATDIWGGTR
jgi:hypothetical protein